MISEQCRFVLNLKIFAKKNSVIHNTKYIILYVSNFNIKLIKFVKDKFFIMECPYMKLRLKVNIIL